MEGAGWDLERDAGPIGGRYLEAVCVRTQCPEYSVLRDDWAVRWGSDLTNSGPSDRTGPAGESATGGRPGAPWF